MNMSAPSQTNQPPKRRRFIRVLMRLMGAILLGLILVVVVSFWLSRQKPDYIEQTQQRVAALTSKQRRTLGRNLQNRIIRELSSPFSSSSGSPDKASNHPTDSNAAALAAAVLTGGIGEIRKVSVTMLELNAWLETELDAWLANQEITPPQGVTEPGVSLVNGQIVLHFLYQWRDYNQYVSFFLKTRIEEEGSAEVRVNSVRAGNMPLPTGAVKTAVGQSNDPQSKLAELRKSLDGKRFDPIIPIDGDHGARRGRVVNIQLEKDQIILSVLIEKNTPKNKTKSAHAPQQ